MNSDTNIHSSSYNITLVLLAISIPLSKFTMSITEFMLLGLWLWSGFSFRISYRFFNLGGIFKGTLHLFKYIVSLAYNNLIDKFTLLFRNKPALIFCLLYVIHILGLLYTSDIDYALKDLRVKLPLILLPVVIATMHKLSYKVLRNLLLLYSLAVLVSTLISTGVYLTGSYIDIREISILISPIRLGLNVSFAAFIMLYFTIHDSNFKLYQKGIFILMGLWFVTFLFLLESVTSIVIIVVLSVLYLIIRVYNTMFLWQKLVLFGIAIIVPLVFFIQVRSMIIDATTAPEINYSELDVFTPYGNQYLHDTADLLIENGKYVSYYICYEELKTEWNRRSNIDYHGKTSTGQRINTTLIRYLTSKDLRKDKDGIMSLTDADISYIEQGTANHNYINNPGLRTRILKMIKGYEVFVRTGNPSGSSLMQRIEYFHTSFNIIRQNLIFGVGTGDLESAFNNEFNRMYSALEERYRYHAHNQFLGIFVALGILGFIIFIIGLFYPAIKLGGFKDYFFTIFFIIIFISMFSDDTIETQAGVTLFAFFYSLLLFGRKKGDNFPANLH